ncbi:MAG: hypothetical protein HYW78_04010 [Parcubacteria group bacterium]|nr:hypothetical protein [Parcubacteria group bacterium]
MQSFMKQSQLSNRPKWFARKILPQPIDKATECSEQKVIKIRSKRAGAKNHSRIVSNETLELFSKLEN